MLTPTQNNALGQILENQQIILAALSMIVPANAAGSNLMLRELRDSTTKALLAADTIKEALEKESG